MSCKIVLNRKIIEKEKKYMAWTTCTLQNILIVSNQADEHESLQLFL